MSALFFYTYWVFLRQNSLSLPDSVFISVKDIGVSQELVEKFLGSDSMSALNEQNFGCQYVVVLPRLSRAKLISVTKKLPDDSKFSSWNSMKRYWKNMYGYRLGDDNEEPVVYYTVSFFGKSPLTYPEWTVRKFEPRPIPRTDPEPIVRAFIQDILVSNKTVCGFEFSLTRPINITNNKNGFTSGRVHQGFNLILAYLIG